MDNDDYDQRLARATSYHNTPQRQISDLPLLLGQLLRTSYPGMPWSTTYSLTLSSLRHVFEIVGWGSKLCLYEDFSDFMTYFVEPGVHHLAWMDAHQNVIEYDEYRQVRSSNFDGKEYVVCLDTHSQVRGMLIVTYEETPAPGWFLDGEPNDYYDSD